MKQAPLIALVALLAFSPAVFAQTQTAPAAKPAPMTKPAATAPAKPAATAPMDKTAKAARSKECSAEADQKGLHGKARKTFREQCKKM